MKNLVKPILAVILILSLDILEPLAFAQSAAKDKTKPADAQQAQPAPLKARPAPSFAFGIEDGTRVSLTLSRELSSGKESAGNRVDFDVAEDVKVNGIVVIPVGSKAWGTIVQAQPRRRMGRAGKLDVKIDEVRLADGERVPLRATQESQGKSRGGAMTAGIVATGILFFPAAPLFLFMHGKDVVIAKGTPVTAYVDGDTALDQAKFAKPGASEPPPSQPASPAAQPAQTPPTAAPATPPTDSPKPPH